jgi:parallel beta-helix repeat protein
LNSVVTGFPGGDGGGPGIRIMLQNALISGNTLAGNYNGIYVTTGSPMISGNTFTGNTSGIMIHDGSPTINSNTITSNGSGITPDTVPQASTNPLISANDISGNGNGIYLGYAGGTWTIMGNTINNNTGDGIYIDNTYSGLSTAGTINGNTISNNASYGIQIVPYNSTPIAITGNTVNNNLTGIYVHTGTSAVSMPSINYNNLFCNTSYDLNTSTTDTIDATYNWWDHATPSGHMQTCDPSSDLCYSLTSPLVNPSSGIASASTCTSTTP